MPELPEVQTLMMGLKDLIEGLIVEEVIIRQRSLRWPVASNLPELLQGQKIGVLQRRGKYLLIPFPSGTLLVHLGMSGTLRLISENTPPKKHDHVDIIFSNSHILRYTDPRRFGAILWTENNPYEHPLLQSLGPEPLGEDFNPEYLLRNCHNRRKNIKQLIMDAHVVVGVGNIYAAESLFLARINPMKLAGIVTEDESIRLVQAIKTVLSRAIIKGGTTIKDFSNSQGKPGYFAQELHVYGRSGQVCLQCKSMLETCKLGQRTTVFCSFCQK